MILSRILFSAGRLSYEILFKRHPEQRLAISFSQMSAPLHDSPHGQRYRMDVERQPMAKLVCVADSFDAALLFGLVQYPTRGRRAGPSALWFI